MNEITFASFITPTGTVVAGTVIMTLIEIGKKVFPGIYKHVNGLQQSFILTVGLYVTGALVVPWDSPDDLLGIFMAGLSCLGTTVAAYEVVVKDVLDHPTEEVIKKDDPPSNPVIGPNDRFDDE